MRENAFNDPSHDNVLHHGYFIANRNNAQVQAAEIHQDEGECLTALASLFHGADGCISVSLRRWLKYGAFACGQISYTVEITDLDSQGFTSWWQTGNAEAQKIHCRSKFPTAALLSHRNGDCILCMLPTSSTHNCIA